MPQTIALFDFAPFNLDDFRWNPKVGRFQRIDGKLISRSAVLNLHLANIAIQRDSLVALAGKLSNGDIDLKEFEKSAGQLVKRIHIQSAIVGKGGLDKMTPEDYLAIGRELKRQYYDGKDPVTGQRFGLKYLAASIRDGLLSDAQIKNSLAMFAASGKVSFFRAEMEVQKSAGLLYGIRKLGKTDNCDDCIGYAGLLPQPIASVILPTQRCKCRVNCGCTIGYLTLEEAIARGMSA